MLAAEITLVSETTGNNPKVFQVPTFFHMLRGSGHPLPLVACVAGSLPAAAVVLRVAIAHRRDLV